MNARIVIANSLFVHLLCIRKPITIRQMTITSDDCVGAIKTNQQTTQPHTHTRINLFSMRDCTRWHRSDFNFCSVFSPLIYFNLAQLLLIWFSWWTLKRAKATIHRLQVDDTYISLCDVAKSTMYSTLWLNRVERTRIRLWIFHENFLTVSLVLLRCDRLPLCIVNNSRFTILYFDFLVWIIVCQDEFKLVDLAVGWSVSSFDSYLSIDFLSLSLFR